MKNQGALVKKEPARVATNATDQTQSGRNTRRGNGRVCVMRIEDA